MAIRAVVFDFGGVLCRLVDYSGRQKWEEKLGLSKGELTRIVLESGVAQRCLLGQVTEAQVWEQTALYLGLNCADIGALQNDFWSGHIVDTQLACLLHALRPRYKTAILSNFWTDARRKFAQVFGMEEGLVDKLIISSEEGLAKPDARIYHLAVHRLGVLPEEMLFIDDSPENIDSARKIGIRGIVFETTGQAEKEIEQTLREWLDVQDSL